MMCIVKLSVIVPIYNSELYLADCLESLVHQNFKDGEYEVICVNDGSQDSSLEIIRDYERKYPFVRCYSKKNEGIAATRNLGLKMARGRYITFVDSDDYIVAESLEKLVNEMERRDVTLLTFGYQCIGETEHYCNEKISKVEFVLSKVTSDQAPFQVWGMVYSREVINRFSFSHKFRTREDYIFNFFVYASNEGQTLLKTDEKIYRYRMRQGSLSHTMDYRSDAFQRERVQDMMNYIDECLTFIELLDNASTRKIVLDKTRYFAATALLAALRSKTVDAKMIQVGLKERKVYPAKLTSIHNVSTAVKMCITSPPIFFVLNRLGVLRKKTIE